MSLYSFDYDYTSAYYYIIWKLSVLAHSEAHSQDAHQRVGPAVDTPARTPQVPECDLHAHPISNLSSLCQ